MEGSEAEVEPPGRLLVAEVVRQVGERFLVGAPFLGTSSFTLPPYIKLFANHLNVAGLDWVDGLKKLTLNPIELRSPIFAAFVEEPPPGPILEPILQDLVSPCSPIESSDLGYFLCSCTKFSSAGLGKDPLGTIRGRGRISHLVKAQSRAKKYVLEGKQISVDRALRAVHARKKGRRQRFYPLTVGVFLVPKKDQHCRGWSR